AGSLEAVAIKRAHDGSDVLLIFLLKARRPDVYRDNHRVEHTERRGSSWTCWTMTTAKPPRWRCGHPPTAENVFAAGRFRPGSAATRSAAGSASACRRSAAAGSA